MQPCQKPPEKCLDLTFCRFLQYQHLFHGTTAAAIFFHILLFNAMTASRISLFVLLFALATTLTGCAAIAGIFKAGAYTGIIAVFIVVALLFFIVNKMRGPR